MTDEKRNKLNNEKIATLSKEMQPKARAVLQDLTAHNWKPLIVEARRTLEEQKEKVRLGYSKTLKSYHLTGNAIDVVDARYMWDSPRLFWLMLISSGLSHGLDSGAFFGLPVKMKEALLRDIKNRNFETKAKLGWDTAHLELRKTS